MNTEPYRQQLLTREQEIVKDLGIVEPAARDSREAEVVDPIDKVIEDEAKAASFQYTSAEREQLADIRAALRRIEDGTYGTCLDCGEPIEPARLHAVPWTMYCLKDQERREQQQAAPADDLFLAE